MQALVQMYSATLDAQYLQQAITAAEWALAQRGAAGRGLSPRREGSPRARILEDTLAMGAGHAGALRRDRRSQLARTLTQAAARFIRRNFATPGAGPAMLSAADRGQVLKPTPQIDENIATARFFNLTRALHRQRRLSRQTPSGRCAFWSHATLRCCARPIPAFCWPTRR